jgi:hypothetical protein
MILTGWLVEVIRKPFKLGLAICTTLYYNARMADNSVVVTFRARPDVRAALEKIIAVKSADYGRFNQTDACSVALLAYAKTLPDPPKENAPREKD